MTFSYVKIMNMDKEKIKKHLLLKKIEKILFWSLFGIFFALVISFFVLSLFLDSSKVSLPLSFSLIISAGLVAILLIFSRIYGASKLQKIVSIVEQYIKEKKYQEGITYLSNISNITYFFVSFDNIYYYLALLLLYDNQLQLSSNYFSFLTKYPNSDTLVIYNSIMYLGLIYLTNEDSKSLSKLNEIYSSLRKKAAYLKNYNKYTSGVLTSIYSVIDKIFSDNKETKLNVLKAYMNIPTIKKYLEKKGKKKND